MCYIINVNIYICIYLQIYTSKSICVLTHANWQPRGCSTPASLLVVRRSLGSPVSKVAALLAMLHCGLRTHKRALAVSSVSPAICSAAGN